MPGLWAPTTRAPLQALLPPLRLPVWLLRSGLRRIRPRKLAPLSLWISNEAKSSLGYWDPDTGEIAINPNQSWVGQNITLLHELIHAVDQAILEAGLSKRRISHKWIESAAFNLLFLLCLSGRWNGVSKRQILKFYRSR